LEGTIGYCSTKKKKKKNCSDDGNLPQKEDVEAEGGFEGEYHKKGGQGATIHSEGMRPAKGEKSGK